MSDIVERLRGQEPLHLGDRLAAADEIDRLRAELAWLCSERPWSLSPPPCAQTERGTGIEKRAGNWQKRYCAMTWLSERQLIALTRRRQPAAQIRVLREAGIPHQT